MPAVGLSPWRGPGEVRPLTNPESGVPATRSAPKLERKGEQPIVAVMIGADPHKGSHTAVAIGTAEKLLGQVRVRARAAQAQRLPAWAAPWPERTWAAGDVGVTACPSAVSCLR